MHNSKEKIQRNLGQENNSSLLATSDTWIESAAIEQLKKTAKLEGMVKAVGMPDLHPGKGSPIGASFLSQNIVYPFLIGGDIGCGMQLTILSRDVSKLHLERMVKKMKNINLKDEIVDSTKSEILKKYGVTNREFNSSLGTIGQGNHFAEVQAIDEVIDVEKFSNYGLDAKKIFLLVHSGSRGYGTQTLREHTDQFRDGGLSTNEVEFEEYFQKHNDALNWAKANRELISLKMCSVLNSKGSFVLDIFHNFVENYFDKKTQSKYWVHRKGAAPANKGLVVIPGSRGDYTYLVEPKDSSFESGYSLAHGAGLKWDRSSTLKKLKNFYTREQLKRTKLGSHVICNQSELLYEEAPDAYKKITSIIKDLEEANLITVIAILKPLITYKPGKPQYSNSKSGKENIKNKSKEKNHRKQIRDSKRALMGKK